MWLLQPGYSTRPDPDNVSALLQLQHSLSWAVQSYSRVPNKGCSPTFGLKISPSPLLIPSCQQLYLWFIPCCSLKPQLFFQRLCHKLIFFCTSLIYAPVFVWISVPAFILSLLFQAPVLSSDLKFTASALSFCYLMHKCICGCNLGWCQKDRSKKN